ncbi:hypothetical protein BP5796_09075 [Coleophoma crateriformis]|uniref:C2H2-type domain-containing protein n=1 Tax=Coleophoma crateriformis TaxID=565419 RepID=A0A3D8R382_9HELO|nr:hypothetical protein BP5796_09075 [Coleophoma crateriformis]
MNPKAPDGAKAFVCPECSNSYTKKYNLKVHIMNKHSDSAFDLLQTAAARVKKQDSSADKNGNNSKEANNTLDQLQGASSCEGPYRQDAAGINSGPSKRKRDEESEKAQAATYKRPRVSDGTGKPDLGFRDSRPRTEGSEEAEVQRPRVHQGPPRSLLPPFGSEFKSGNGKRAFSDMNKEDELQNSSKRARVDETSARGRPEDHRQTLVQQRPVVKFKITGNRGQQSKSLNKPAPLSGVLLGEEEPRAPIANRQSRRRYGSPEPAPAIRTETGAWHTCQAKHVDLYSLHTRHHDDHFPNEKIEMEFKIMSSSIDRNATLQKRNILKLKFEDQAFMKDEPSAHPKLVKAVRDIFRVPHHMPIATKLSNPKIVFPDPLIFARGILAYLLRDLIFGNQFFPEQKAWRSTLEHFFPREVAERLCKEHYVIQEQSPGFEELLAAKTEEYAIEFDNIMVTVTGANDEVQADHRRMIRKALETNVKIVQRNHLNYTEIWANYDDRYDPKLHDYKWCDTESDLPPAELKGRRVFMTRHSGLKIELPDEPFYVVFPANVKLQDLETPPPKRPAKGVIA